jgi:hypothetical protein
MRKRIFPTLIACAFLPMLLIGCGEEFSDRQAILAAIPDEHRACFGEVIEPQLPPAGQPLSRRQVLALVDYLHTDRVRRTHCGRQLIAFYDAQRQVYNRREGFRLPFSR